MSLLFYQLNYHPKKFLTGMTGIEPISSVLETDILPLNYTPFLKKNLKRRMGIEPILINTEFIILPFELPPPTYLLIFFNNNGLSGIRTHDKFITYASFQN